MSQPGLFADEQFVIRLLAGAPAGLTIPEIRRALLFKRVRPVLDQLNRRQLVTARATRGRHLVWSQRRGDNR